MQLEKCVMENGARSSQLAAANDDFPFLQADFPFCKTCQKTQLKEYSIE